MVSRASRSPFFVEKVGREVPAKPAKALADSLDCASSSLLRSLRTEELRDTKLTAFGQALVVKSMRPKRLESPRNSLLRGELPEFRGPKCGAELVSMPTPAPNEVLKELGQLFIELFGLKSL